MIFLWSKRNNHIFTTAESQKSNDKIENLIRTILSSIAKDGENPAKNHPNGIWQHTTIAIILQLCLPEEAKEKENNKKCQLITLNL